MFINVNNFLINIVEIYKVRVDEDDIAIYFSLKNSEELCFNFDDIEDCLKEWKKIKRILKRPII